MTKLFSVFFRLFSRKIHRTHTYYEFFISTPNWSRFLKTSRKYHTFLLTGERGRGGHCQELIHNQHQSGVDHVNQSGNGPHHPTQQQRQCLLWACKACKKRVVRVDRRHAATMRERKRLRKVHKFTNF